MNCEQTLLIRQLNIEHFQMPATSLWLVALSLALSHGRGIRFLLRVRGCEYSIINCRIYNKAEACDSTDSTARRANAVIVKCKKK